MHKKGKIYINNVVATALDLVALFEFTKQGKVRITAVHSLKNGDTKIYYVG